MTTGRWIALGLCALVAAVGGPVLDIFAVAGSAITVASRDTTKV